MVAGCVVTFELELDRLSDSAHLCEKHAARSRSPWVGRSRDRLGRSSNPALSAIAHVSQTLERRCWLGIVRFKTELPGHFRPCRKRRIRRRPWPEVSRGRAGLGRGRLELGQLATRDGERLHVLHQAWIPNPCSICRYHIALGEPCCRSCVPEQRPAQR